MNWLRMLLHVMALALLTAVTAGVILYGLQLWKQAHPPRRTGHYVVMKSDDNAVAVQAAVQAYYKVYGHWPASWREVRKSLVFQRDLFTLDAKRLPINPGDGRIDFSEDVVYKPGSSPKILITVMGGQRTINLFPPTTYREWLPAIEKSRSHPATTTWYTYQDPKTAFKADKYLSSKKRLVQLAIVGQLGALASRDTARNGSSPSLSTMVALPSSPIDIYSINPVTGKPFKFDGSANDVWVSSGAGEPLTLVPILEDGHHPTYYFTP